jgi:hypothetical protein
MLEVLRLAAAVLSRLVPAESAGQAVARVAAVLVLGAFAATVIVGAIGCAAAGLWIYLLPRAGPAGAPFITALALLLVSAALAGGAYPILRAKRRRRKAAGTAAGAADLGLAFDLGARARRAGLGLVREHKTSLLLAALIGGLVLGSSDALARSRRDRR